MTPGARRPRAQLQEPPGGEGALDRNQSLNGILDALALHRWNTAQANDPELTQAWLHQLDEALLLDETKHALLHYDSSRHNRPLAPADLEVMRDQALTLLAAWPVRRQEQRKRKEKQHTRRSAPVPAYDRPGRPLPTPPEG